VQGPDELELPEEPEEPELPEELEEPELPGEPEPDPEEVELDPGPDGREPELDADPPDPLEPAPDSAPWPDVVPAVEPDSPPPPASSPLAKVPPGDEPQAIVTARAKPETAHVVFMAASAPLRARPPLPTSPGDSGRVPPFLAVASRGEIRRPKCTHRAIQRQGINQLAT
jgi:hypothetical protein